MQIAKHFGMGESLENLITARRLKRIQEDKMRKRRKAEVNSEVSDQPVEATACFSSITLARHRCVTTRPKGQVMSRLPVLSSTCVCEGHLFNLPSTEEHHH